MKDVSHNLRIGNTGSRYYWDVNNRGWKGCSVVRVDRENGCSIHADDAVDDEHGGQLYMCLTHCKTKSAAWKIVDRLNDQATTAYAVALATLKSMEKYLDKLEAGTASAGMPRQMARQQFEYFGATEADLARYDAYYARRMEYIRKSIEDRKAKA